MCYARSSLTVKHSRDNHKCNSSDNSRSRDYGTRNVKSLELTRKPKETIAKAGGESFSGEEAKPRVTKINCRVAKALSASDGHSAP